MSGGLHGCRCSLCFFCACFVDVRECLGLTCFLTVVLHAPSLFLPSFGPFGFPFSSFKGFKGLMVRGRARPHLPLESSSIFFWGSFVYFFWFCVDFSLFFFWCLLVVVPPLFIRPEGSLYVSISTLIMQTHLNSEVQVKCTCAAKFSPKNKPAEIPSRGWPRACPSLLVSLPLVVKPCPQVALPAPTSANPAQEKP